MPPVEKTTYVILVVEDEWLLSAAMVAELKARAWKVVEASSGEEAVALLSNGSVRPEVVFTDIRLGGELDGRNVAKRFRRENSAVGIVYTSGNVGNYPVDVPLRIDYFEFA